MTPKLPEILVIFYIFFGFVLSRTIFPSQKAITQLFVMMRKGSYRKYLCKKGSYRKYIVMTVTFSLLGVELGRAPGSPSAKAPLTVHRATARRRCGALCANVPMGASTGVTWSDRLPTKAHRRGATRATTAEPVTRAAAAARKRSR